MPRKQVKGLPLQPTSKRAGDVFESDKIVDAYQMESYVREVEATFLKLNAKLARLRTTNRRLKNQAKHDGPLKLQWAVLDMALHQLAKKWLEENGDYPESKQDCANELLTKLAEFTRRNNYGS